jgi:hypothetical protein
VEKQRLGCPAHRCGYLIGGNWVGEAMLSFGSARMGSAEEQLPQMQSWVGEIKSKGTLITVTLMMYGETALAVACRQ